ncbi:MAG: hypothetical protein ACI9RM_001076 [Ulvibacter sp.]|jgi:hypothetical protein
MIISISKTFRHDSPSGKKANLGQDEIQKFVLNLLEKVGISPNEFKWNEHGNLELKESNNLKLHTLTLEMEKLGLDLKLTKQTLIEIC